MHPRSACVSSVHALLGGGIRSRGRDRASLYMLLLGCTVSWAAGADDARAVPAPAAIVHLRVPLRGVDLYSASGVASFYRRLERAAKRACDYGNIPGYYDKHCAADALDRAVAGRGVPALDRLHAERTRDRGPRRDPEVVRLVCGSDRPLERVCGP